MNSKSKRLISTMLAVMIVAGMLAAMPLTTSAAVTHTTSDAADLGSLLSFAASGDTIKLLADITYPSEIFFDDGRTIIFDLNGKTLNATGGLYAGNGTKILLKDPSNGQLNVSGKADSGSLTVFAGGIGSKVEVTSISTSVDGVWAAYTNSGGSEIIVYGNITHTGTSGRAACVAGQSQITVNGTITVSPGVTFAMIGNIEITKDQHEETSSRPGYLEYKTVVGTLISYLWVVPSATVGPTAVSFDKGNSGDINLIVDLAGHDPVSITNGAYTLQPGTDFVIVNSSTVTLKAAYLNTLDVGVHTISFNFSGGESPTLTVTVTEQTITAPAISMSNFVKTKTYTSGMFTDVDENQWYGYTQYKVIATAYEYNLMQGSGNTFNPTGNMLLSEAITIAVRVHSIYNGGTGELTPGSPWYQVYVDYAITNGIINSGTFSDYNKPATRAEMAYIFSRALPAAEFKLQNTVNSLPDVNASTPYSAAIVLLYQAGVVSGSDDKGTFNPGSNIIRAEAATIISRVILPESRVSGKTY